MRTTTRTPISVILVSASVAVGGGQPPVGICPTEPLVALRGGGMAGDGWDGPGQGSAVITYHIESYSPDLTVVEQRAAVAAALATWANIVQIDFVEIALPNRNKSIDLRFAVLDHCAVESAECGDPDCPFDGPFGVLAHAGFPPGVSSQCIDPMPETFAGNVHLDEDELWEMDNANANPNDFSMALVSAHEIGHAIGLTHDTGPGGPHIMAPSIPASMGLFPPSASDIAHLRSGYAAGTGSVTSFETGGMWVNSAYPGPGLGTPGDPIHTVGGAVEALPTQTTGITVHVLGGLYPGPVTIDKPCTVTSEFSTAFIGQ